jgi:hypothetical protein
LQLRRAGSFVVVDSSSLDYDFEFIGYKDYVMRFGLNFFPSFRLQDMSTADYYELGLRLSERADELGFASVKTVEHYFHDYGGHSPNPIVLLSAIAARTRRIRLITGADTAFNNPSSSPPSWRCSITSATAGSTRASDVPSSQRSSTSSG